MRVSKPIVLGAAALFGLGLTTAFAADTIAPAPPPLKIDSGDTAWMLTSAALVLMMTVPGLGLFYGGMVRKKNVGDTVMTSFAVTCLVTIVYAVISYSLAFTPGSPFIGGTSRMFLQGILSDISNGTGNPNGWSQAARLATGRRRQTRQRESGWALAPGLGSDSGAGWGSEMGERWVMAKLSPDREGRLRRSE